jgi:uncharacterized damage-inducible protein DinB
MYAFAKEQYDFVRESRAVLLEYCRTMADNDFIKTNPSFGRGGSIRNLLVHIATTYQFWIGKCALERDMVFTAYESIQNMSAVMDLFKSIDFLMSDFIELLQKPEQKKISYKINGAVKAEAPFKLFSHVITHEFHHKGQILTLSRHWGYTPIDTDIMR